MYGDNSTPVFPKDDALTMIRLALAEDVRTGDVTSEWTIPADQKQHARLIAKEDGVLAGLPVIELVFQELKANVKVTLHKKDGDVVKKGDLIAEMDGRTHAFEFYSATFRRGNRCAYLPGSLEGGEDQGSRYAQDGSRFPHSAEVRRSRGWRF